MGFRDLHAFNISMLAKQSWRLITNPDSLCAQILRAKYYPDGNLLKDGPKQGSSFTWQSIIAGLNTFRRGHILRVGSGNLINIWEYHWIPLSPDQVFFLDLVSFTGGHRNNWLPRNLRNTAYLPNEFF
jgi:hypothetical protein